MSDQVETSTAKPFVNIAAAAAGASRTYQGQANAFLRNQLSSMLSKAGRAGSFAAGLGVLADLANGDKRSAVFDAVDYLVYSTVAEIGAAGAVETLGGSAALSAATLGMYYHSGGSKGLVQSTFCKKVR